MLSGNKNKQIIVTYKDIEKSHNYNVEQKKPDIPKKKYILYGFINIKSKRGWANLYCYK